MPGTKKPVLGMANEAAAAPWHCAQAERVLGALACTRASEGRTVKSGLWWQSLQAVPTAVGMWLPALVAPGRKERVTWHWSHEATVGGWPSGLPGARRPVWQVLQLPGATLRWLKRAPVKAVRVWQLSQDSVVCRCRAGMARAPRGLYWAWQVAQSVPDGVPLAVRQDAELRETVVEAALGLTADEAKSVFAKSLVKTRDFDVDTLTKGAIRFAGDTIEVN